MAISVDAAQVACTKRTPVRVVVQKGAEKVNYIGTITSVPPTHNERFATVSGRKEGEQGPATSLGWVSLGSIFLLNDPKGEGDNADPPSFTEQP